MEIDKSKKYTATFTMDGGDQFVIELFADKAPVTVNSFVSLARAGFYDGTQFPMVLTTLGGAIALFLCFWGLVWPRRETAAD